MATIRFNKFLKDRLHERLLFRLACRSVSRRQEMAVDEASRLRLITTLILSGLAIISISCVESSKSDYEAGQELLTLEKKFLEKEFALDTASLASLMDSTFIDITDDGVKDKQEDLIDIYYNIDQRLKQGTVPDSFKLENEVVNVYSNSAVVTVTVHSFRHSGDTSIERRTRFYDVWIRRDTEWKLAASQGTVIPNKNKD